MIMMHEIVHKLVVESLGSLSVGGQLPDRAMVLLLTARAGIIPPLSAGNGLIVGAVVLAMIRSITSRL